MNSRSSVHSHSRFVPLSLLGIAVLIWLGFQSWQLVAEHRQIRQLISSQTQAVRHATAFRAKLDEVVRETSLLAADGNPQAKMMADELRKRRITSKPDAAPQAASASGRQ